MALSRAWWGGFKDALLLRVMENSGSTVADELRTRFRHQIERLIAVRKPAEYDQTVQLLVDLRDAADRAGEVDEFEEELESVRRRHALKSTLLHRIDEAGLG